MSTFGTHFRVTTFGESHCFGVGCIVDGVPPRMDLCEADIQPQLTRRRPGQSKLSTPRNEADKVTIMSGTEYGRTLGTPIGMMVRNKDQRPGDYKTMSAHPRPSHADYTYHEKYGTHSRSGGGRSARETIGRVAAGAIAEKWLKERFGVEIVAWVSSVGAEKLGDDEVNIDTITRAEVDETVPVRCAAPGAVDRFTKVIQDARDDHDSIGGTVRCVCRGMPSGWGEPCFDKMEAQLAHAMLSIPATKGFEIGSGFGGCEMRGSAHNDAFAAREDGEHEQGGRLRTLTNNSGGIQGGITNGEAITFRIAFKPPATIGKEQATATYTGEEGTLASKGRHDPCVVNRAIPIVEAMAALVLADAALGQLARDASAPRTDKPASTTPLPQKPLPTPEEMAAAAAKVDAASGSGPSSWDAKAATAAEPPAKKQKT